MRNLKRFSLRAMLLIIALVAAALWLFLPLIRNDAYAEFEVVDVLGNAGK